MPSCFDLQAPFTDSLFHTPQHNLGVESHLAAEGRLGCTPGSTVDNCCKNMHGPAPLLDFITRPACGKTAPLSTPTQGCTTTLRDCTSLLLSLSLSPCIPTPAQTPPVLNVPIRRRRAHPPQPVRSPGIKPINTHRMGVDHRHTPTPHTPPWCATTVAASAAQPLMAPRAWLSVLGSWACCARCSRWRAPTRGHPVQGGSRCGRRTACCSCPRSARRRSADSRHQHSATPVVKDGGVSGEALRSQQSDTKKYTMKMAACCRCVAWW